MLSLLLLPSLALALPSCFHVLPAKVLRGTSLTIMDDLSLKQCQVACLDTNKCRSLSYSQKSRLCQLNAEDSHSRRLENGHHIWDYYERTCYDKPSVAIQRDEPSVAHSGECFQQTKGKVLIGIVDQLIQDVESIDLCQVACQKSQEKRDIVCKSAAYYAKEKECIIASQSRLDIPDLFIDDENSIYIENVCLVNTQKSEDVKKVEPKNPDDAEDTTVDNISMDEELASASPTTLSSLLQSPKYDLSKSGPVAPPVEESGYDAPSDTVSNRHGEQFIPSSTTTTTTTTTTTAPPSTIPDKVVDSYAVDLPVKETKPSEAPGYARRLHDERMKTCFTEVRSPSTFDEARITKAYSLEQCTDICRLCWRCLKGKKCQSVAFDGTREFCALSLSPLSSSKHSTNKKKGLLFYNRGEC